MSAAADRPPTRRHFRPYPAAGAVLLVAVAAAVGVPGCQQRPAPTRRDRPAVSGPELDQRIHEVCSRCHAYPPPETFPRADWKYEVEQAYGFIQLYNPPGLSPPPIDAVVKHFEDRAPEKLPPAEFTDAAAPLPVDFRAIAVPPPPGELKETGPVISNVNLVHLYDDSHLDILATDMASGLVMSLRPTDPKPAWNVLARLRHPDHPDEPANPAHTEVVDLFGGGHKDILVADLGSFLPTDSRCGRVVWLRDDGGGRYTPFTLLDGVGRVADVQAAHFRGPDKPMDLVVGVFGWQKTGEILYLKNESPDRDHPKFVPRILDERHGTIHVPVCHLQGDPGKNDFIALISQEHETVVAFLNDGKGGFEKKTIFTAPHPAYGSSGIQVVDMNRDGLPDVLYTNGDVLDKPYLLKPYHSVQWLENPGVGKFPWIHHPLTPMYGVHRAVAADLTGHGDGTLDVAAVNFLPYGPTHEDGFPERETLHPDSLIVLRQTGPTTFERHGLEDTSCDHVTCAAGDLYGTGRMDLVVGNFSPHRAAAAVTIWRNLGPRK